MTEHERASAHTFMKRERKLQLKQPKILRLLGIQNFMWVIGLGCIVAVGQTFGTPHLLYTYEYIESSGQRTSCTYFGLHSQEIAAIDGDCALVTLLKEKR